MNNKKEQERAELHKTTWALANELRGAVDGWDFKMYVLGFIFYRFISEDFVSIFGGKARKKELLAERLQEYFDKNRGLVYISKGDNYC